MELNPLTALSPLDGRYAGKTSALRPVFSEFGLIRCRLQVEIQWLQALSDEKAIPEVRALTMEERGILQDILAQFSEADGWRVKEIERKTNHDVKAVEYFLKEKLADTSLASLREFIHFACTSEDINNLSYGLMMRQAKVEVMLPVMTGLRQKLAELALSLSQVPMLARTHGQAATPTTLGKELANVVARLDRQLETFRHVPIYGKINGATGNFNAHVVSYPLVDWPSLSRRVVEDLGLTWQPLTTQIEPHDGMAEMFHVLMRFNTVLLDLCRDLWSYISIGYFRQKTKEGEVGSSTMPHKVNPIDFENAEGNLGVANALLGHLAEKLPVSRLQRDLSDSTVQRNIGVAYGYSLLAYHSAMVGLGKLEVDTHKLAQDLDHTWEILAEAVQTVMRRYNVPEPYEKLKALTRGQQITQHTLQQFIESLPLPPEVIGQLMAMRPGDYTGLADHLTRQIQK
ncbi:MAG: adenylosuccinate lyase [Magnetococcales bacterium]|nr:adenylosuccinate lyase [Magnetococcales bacterium]